MLPPRLPPQPFVVKNTPCLHPSPSFYHQQDFFALTPLSTSLIPTTTHPPPPMRQAPFPKSTRRQTRGGQHQQQGQQQQEQPEKQQQQHCAPREHQQRKDTHSLCRTINSIIFSTL